MQIRAELPAQLAVILLFRFMRSNAFCTWAKMASTEDASSSLTLSMTLLLSSSTQPEMNE
jgi:hypothetical protein